MKRKKKIKYNNIIVLFNIIICILLYINLNNNINGNIIKLTIILLLGILSIAMKSE